MASPRCCCWELITRAYEASLGWCWGLLPLLVAFVSPSLTTPGSLGSALGWLCPTPTGSWLLFPKQLLFLPWGDNSGHGLLPVDFHKTYMPVP